VFHSSLLAVRHDTPQGKPFILGLPFIPVSEHSLHKVNQSI
jgi:hypothetical protein